MSLIKSSIGQRDEIGPDFLSQIKPIPGHSSYKSITEKDIIDYAESIKANGIIKPILLWDRGQQGVFCISGNQEIRALKYLIDQGFSIDKIPAEWLEIETEEQAWQLVLAHDSAYGKVNKDFNPESIPVKKQYIEIMRTSRPAAMGKKPRVAKEDKNKLSFKKGDVIRLDCLEVEIPAGALDFSIDLKLTVDSVASAEKLVKKYIEDCRRKRKTPQIMVNGERMF